MKTRKQGAGPSYGWSILLVSLVALGAIWILTPSQSSLKQSSTWLQMVEPGALSKVHAHLENNCAACHTSVRGVEAAKCITCHANNESVLQRQPTSFHANISSCVECHQEHKGLGNYPVQMSHQALTQIGFNQLESDEPDSENATTLANLAMWTENHVSANQRISIKEAILNCATCHRNDDRHFELFGDDCAQCHGTDHWTIPEFRHPPSSSMDCAQCHQAPPSHYMMNHFKMISARVAGKPKANVDQCFQCHQTTSWNDILDAGWYKHH